MVDKTEKQTEWTEARLLSMIEMKVRESIELDYKASAALENTNANKNEISKDVSAFANSAGGTIIYGIAEGKDHNPNSIDEGIDPSKITTEWLEQVINSSILPRIQGVLISRIDLDKTRPGRSAYIVDIPQSTRPHQASDKKFYKRYNFQSVPMEEYEIRDLYNRQQTPDLRITLWPLFVVEFTKESGYSKPVKFNFTITNDAVAPADYAHIMFFLDERLKLLKPLTTTSIYHQATISDEEYRLKMATQINWAIPHQMPIFFGVNFNIFSEPMEIQVPKPMAGNSSKFAIGWEIKSPRMTPKKGYAVYQLKQKDGHFCLHDAEIDFH